LTEACFTGSVTPVMAGALATGAAATTRRRSILHQSHLGGRPKPVHGLPAPSTISPAPTKPPSSGQGDSTYQASRGSSPSGLRQCPSAPRWLKEQSSSRFAFPSHRLIRDARLAFSCRLPTQNSSLPPTEGSLGIGQFAKARCPTYSTFPEETAPMAKQPVGASRWTQGPLESYDATYTGGIRTSGLR